MHHSGGGQEHDNLYSNASELVEGNEESGQAAPSSTTGSSDDNTKIIGNDDNIAGLPLVDDVSYSINDDLTISPYEASDSSSDEVTNPSTEVATIEGGGDWFGLGDERNNNMQQVPTLMDFLMHILVAGSIALALCLVMEILNGMVRGPSLRRATYKRDSRFYGKRKRY